MEATSTGPNRTGAAVHPEAIAKMLEASKQQQQRRTPAQAADSQQMDLERQRYIAESDSVGSIPQPRSALKSAAAKLKGVTGATTLGTLLDKLGERAAFERTGTRLYDAAITKCIALAGEGEIPLAPAAREGAVETLTRIRDQELQHFQMLSGCIEQLGGDPTAQTPCADVVAAASAGLLAVVADPRTTLAQSLNAVLTAELVDNAGWELLSELAELAGQEQLLEPFAEALAVEEEHLETVRAWLRTLVTEAPGTIAV